MSETRTITIGQTIELPEGDFTVASYSSGTFRLRDENTGEYHLVHHLELGRILPPATKVQQAAPPKPLEEVESLLDSDTRMLVPHLQELVDGTPAVGDMPRPEYAAHIPMTWKLTSKRKELEGLGIVISDGTLKRRMLRFRKAGVEALLDKRTGRTETTLARMDKRIKEPLAELIASYEGRSSPSYSRLRAELGRLLMLQYEDPDDRPPLPSLSTLQRYVTVLSGGKNPTKPGRQRETEALSPTRQHRPRLVTAPGDECQIDTTRLDAFVRMPDGTVARPFLTILIDKRTRSIIGHNLTATAPTGYDHAVLLAKALVPRRLRSWSKHYDAFGLPPMPWGKHLSESQREEFDAHRPYIFPRRILIDNGQDYRGIVFRLACERFGIHLTEAPPKHPTAKAMVERAFGTIRTKFTQFLPGYTNANVHYLGKKAAKEDVLDLDTVDELFDRWTAIVYQNRQHTGLVDHQDPSVRHTPNTMFAASIELAGHFVLAYDEPDFISLMPSETRTVKSDGIEFRGRKYDSPHLGPLRGRKRSGGVSHLVRAHYDPGDNTRIWVRADSGEWITCTWTRERGMSRPMEKELHRAAHQLTSARPGFADDQADSLMLALRDEIVGESRGRSEKTANTEVPQKAVKPAPVARVLVDDVDDEDFGDYGDVRVVG
jgi:transposase InsO family protein